LIRAILDVDTGVDDALAIALAVRHPEVQLEAVVSVAGNVSLELTTRNTLRVLDWLGASDVPVYAGSDRPLRGEPREASHWHGVDGLGGAELPETRRAANTGGVDNLCQRILSAPGELTLVCTAPLTNLALAVQREPRIVQSVREVVLMGGNVRPPGNSTPMAEFNIYADPDAAALVFEQDWPITMVGLDVTEQVTLTRAERQTLAARTSPEAVLVREVTRYLFDVRGISSFALHDPLALAVAVQPDLVTTTRRDVKVETRGEHTLGQTVVDLRPSAPPPRLNTRVCTEVDAARAKDFFFTTLFEPVGL
jgi:inosine-uridine nucleoside N-ribohydrolase